MIPRRRPHTLSQVGARKVDSKTSQTKAFTTKTPSEKTTTPALEANAPPIEAPSSKPAKPSSDKVPAKADSERAFKFDDQPFTEAMLAQTLTAAANKDGVVDGPSLQSAFALMSAQAPRDHFEMMLINQMNSLNALVMRYAGLLGRAADPAEVEIYGGAFNKLGRTFLAYVEVLHRYRSNGDQKVVVQQNVSVSDGGQAIVGNIGQNPGVPEKPNSAPAMIADQRTVPMPIIEPDEIVPVSAKRRPLR